MHLATLLATLLPLTLAHPNPNTALTKGTTTILNKCPFPLTIWTVSSTITSTTPVPAGASATQPYQYDPKTGIALKIGTSENALSNGSPILHFSYSLNPAENSIYYDLSTVFGLDEKFVGKKFVVTGDRKDVPRIEWDGGRPSGTKAFFGDVDLTLTLCA